MLDSAMRGSLCSKKSGSVKVLIEEMATNGYQWSSKRKEVVKEAGIYEVEALTTFVA